MKRTSEAHRAEMASRKERRAKRKATPQVALLALANAARTKLGLPALKPRRERYTPAKLRELRATLHNFHGELRR